MTYGPILRRLLLFPVCLLLLCLPAAAYDPGTGTLFSEDFDGVMDEDWEEPTGTGGEPSPWTKVLDDGDWSYYADGYGPQAGSPTRHWARRFLHPVVATTFSIAMQYRSEIGAGYTFDLEVQQRAEILRKYRLRIDADGYASLWRTEGGVFNMMAVTGSRVVQANKDRWLRLAIESDPSGHPRVRARIWSRKVTQEPDTWDLDFLDDLDTLERVHRFEIAADGPKGVETWIDDLDAWGDVGIGVASSIQTIWLMELSHLDIGFTEPPDDIETFAKTHLDQVLDNLDADPDYRWFIEEGWWLDRWWERSTATQQDRLVSRLQEGRLMLGAGYGSLHTTTAGHEELTRNIYYSSGMGRQHGFPVRTWITDDVPGTTFAVPEILARSGIDYFIGGMNTGFGGRVTHPDHGDRPFWWVGPDGSKVLSWTTFDSYAEAFDYGFSFFDNFDDLFYKLGKKLPEQEEAGYDWPDMLMIRGFDNHYQGFKARDLVNQWNATYSNPVFVLANPEEFLDHMLATHGPEAFPEFSGDYGCAWSNSHAGAQHIEDWVRQAHREARAAEALLAAGASLDGTPAPLPDMAFMYRKILEVDEHTGPGGWPGYFTPEEMDRNNRIHLGYAEDARDTARALLEQGLDRSLSGLSAAGDAVAAVNPLGRARDGWVRIALPPEIYGSDFRVVDRGTGAERPYQKFDATSEILFRAEDVPAMGYRVFDLVPGTPAADPAGMLEVTATSLENDYYRIDLDAVDGSVVSMVEKSTGRELVDTASPYKFNQLATNTKFQYDYQQPPVAEPPASATVTIEHAGPLMASLKATYTGTPHVETTYRLYRNEDRVEFENVLDRDRMPYVPQSTSVIAYVTTLNFDIHDFNIRTETTTRFLDPIADGFERPNLFDWHNVEHTLALWDENGGIYYAVDSVDAHHLENLSSLTSAAFSTGDALVLSRLKNQSDEYEFDGGTVGPYEMEPDTSPIYRYTHHVRGTPASFDPVEASRFGFEALEPLQPRLLSRGPGNLPDDTASFFRIDAPNVLMYTAKPADVGEGVVIRMNELTGAESTVVEVTSDIFVLENPERVEQDEDGGVPLASSGNGFVVTVGPYETATVRARPSKTWSPIVLMVDKNAGTGEVLLDWAEGVSPYTVRRSEDAAFGTAVTVVDEEPVTSHADPVLHDGSTCFYLVD